MFRKTACLTIDTAYHCCPGTNKHHEGHHFVCLVLIVFVLCTRRCMQYSIRHIPLVLLTTRATAVAEVDQDEVEENRTQDSTVVRLPADNAMDGRKQTLHPVVATPTLHPTNPSSAHRHDRARPFTRVGHTQHVYMAIFSFSFLERGRANPRELGRVF